MISVSGSRRARSMYRSANSRFVSGRKERTAVILFVKFQIHVLAVFVIFQGYLETFLRHELSGYVGSHVEGMRHHQVPVGIGLFHGVLEGWLSRREAERVVCVAQRFRFPSGR